MATEPEYYWDAVFVREFEKESDRACVILSVAMLERALESMLKACLVATGSREDSLLDVAYAPLSTFSAKIALAHRLGLISTKFCRDLHTIRKIRNAFAHDITECTFKNASVHSRVVELCRSSGLVDKEKETRKRFQEGSRGDFQMIVSWMLWHLWSQLKDIVSLEERPLEPAYWSKEKLEREKKALEKKQKASSLKCRKKD
jgi:DNA-binding MltR family transcriptional regulator